MNLNRFQGFIKSLDLNRTKENYEELVKIKKVQFKFYYKQQCIMDYSERMIFLIHNCEQDLKRLNEIKNEDISKRYMDIYYFNQDLIKSFVTNFECATSEYKSIVNKINLALGDAGILLFNSILSEQDYLLTESYLTKIKNRFHNQLGDLQESYNDFKCFLNDKILNDDKDFNNNS